ncbi:MAG: elongation factor P [Defluviicoccus sp.]|nr:elongation factor P [Defluviicoccus sp.]
MKVNANTIRPGHVIEHDGKQWSVLKIQILQPGKGGAFVQVEMRDVMTGTKSNERFRTQESVEKLMVDEKSCTYLYRADDSVTLMDTETYEQFDLPVGMIGGPVAYLQDGMTITLDLIEGKPVAARLPQQVTMAVTEADPVVKGQTASSSFKPAMLENGARVMVPPHIEAGTRIVVNTEDGSYIERAKG